MPPAERRARQSKRGATPWVRFGILQFSGVSCWFAANKLRGLRQLGGPDLKIQEKNRRPSGFAVVHDPYLTPCAATCAPATPHFFARLQQRASAMKSARRSRVKLAPSAAPSNQANSTIDILYVNIKAVDKVRAPPASTFHGVGRS
jgi:hypothetical protein